MTHKAFHRLVREHYRTHGRHRLPWRLTNNPYRVLVSEVMLQQTQVERVIPKYKAFVKAFPNFETLASAKLSAVLRLWQGLGYNRRALSLHRLAQQVMFRYGGKLPENPETLRLLPGIGSYTAGALLAFAFNKPAVIVETNIRQVYIHHFFQNHSTVDDAVVVKKIAATLPRRNYRLWYWALMDYGAHLKKEYGNINSKSKQYRAQSKFQGSHRQLRGQVLRLLSHQALSAASLSQKLQKPSVLVAAALATLCKEGLISKNRHFYRIG